MRTYNRICLQDINLSVSDVQPFPKLERGKEYTTSEVDENGCLTVFAGCWIRMEYDPTIFGGEQVSTES